MSAHREIWLMSGPRERRVPLRIESRYDVSVRPAYRPDDAPPSYLEVADAWLFPRLGWVLVPLTFALVAAVAIAQALRHFHGG